MTREERRAASSVPFLITRSRPPCSVTNSRPSGANAIAVGAASPVATCVSAKPVGSVAAGAAGTTASAATQLSSTTVFLETVGGAGIIGYPFRRDGDASG